MYRLSSKSKVKPDPRVHDSTGRRAESIVATTDGIWKHLIERSVTKFDKSPYGNAVIAYRRDHNMGQFLRIITSQTGGCFGSDEWLQMFISNATENYDYGDGRGGIDGTVIGLRSLLVPISTLKQDGDMKAEMSAISDRDDFLRAIKEYVYANGFMTQILASNRHSVEYPESLYMSQIIFNVTQYYGREIMIKMAQRSHNLPAVDSLDHPDMEEYSDLVPSPGDWKNFLKEYTRSFIMKDGTGVNVRRRVLDFGLDATLLNFLPFDKQIGQCGARQSAFFGPRYCSQQMIFSGCSTLVLSEKTLSGIGEGLLREMKPRSLMLKQTSFSFDLRVAVFSFSIGRTPDSDGTSIFHRLIQYFLIKINSGTRVEAINIKDAYSQYQMDTTQPKAPLFIHGYNKYHVVMVTCHNIGNNCCIMLPCSSEAEVLMRAMQIQIDDIYFMSMKYANPSQARSEGWDTAQIPTHLFVVVKITCIRPLFEESFFSPLMGNNLTKADLEDAKEKAREAIYIGDHNSSIHNVATQSDEFDNKDVQSLMLFSDILQESATASESVNSRQSIIKECKFILSLISDRILQPGQPPIRYQTLTDGNIDAISAEGIVNMAEFEAMKDILRRIFTIKQYLLGHPLLGGGTSISKRKKMSTTRKKKRITWKKQRRSIKRLHYTVKRKK